MDKKEKTLYIVITLLVVSLAIFGVWIEGPTNAFRQVLMLQGQSAQLINDFTVYGSR